MKNIKNILEKPIFKVYLWLFRVYGGQILKSYSRHRDAALGKAYIRAISLFPDNKLGDNLKIAVCVRNRLFELSTDEDNSAIDKNQIQKLYETVSTDEWIKKTLSNYFLLEAFYYSYGNTSDAFKEKIESAVEKSKKYADSATPITAKNLHSVDKAIKSDLKRFKKEVRKLSAAKCKARKLEYIKPTFQFSITSNHVVFLSSIFSFFFLVSGFFYNHMFFNSLGVNVEDFFDISDYLTSGVSTLSDVLIATLVGMFSYVLGVNEAMNREFDEKEFDTKYKERSFHLLYVAVLIRLPFDWYYAGITPSDNYLLVPAIMMSFFYILRYGMSWFPRDYIKNPSLVVGVFVSILTFSIQLWSSAKEDIDAIKSGDYISPYKVEFTEDYEKHSNDKFISANSNYVFMWDQASKELSIIPKSGVIRFSVNQDDLPS